jgi:hypothetical protein
MAWTAPMTAVSGSVFTAAQFNQMIRDNLNETAPAKVTTAGQYVVADGANSIVARSVVGATDLDSGTTTSTTYADLAGPALVGPQATLLTGSQALVFYHAQCLNSGAGSARVSVEVTGASSIATADNRSVATFGIADNGLGASTTVFYTGGLALTPGLNTFTMKYRVSSGTGTFDDRRLIVMPL